MSKRKTDSSLQNSLFSQLEPNVVWPEGYKSDLTTFDFEKTKVIGLDIETDSSLNYLDPNRKILCIGISTQAHKASSLWVYAGISSHTLTFIKSILANPNYILVGHNIKFDVNWLRYKYGFDIRCQLFDTRVASWLLNENRFRVTLEDLCGLLLATDENKSLIDYKKEIDRSNLLKYPKDEILIYNCRDADSSYQLFKPLSQRIQNAGLQNLAQVTMEVLPVISKMETHGVYIDQQWYNNEKSRLLARIINSRNTLTALRGSPFDPNSTNDLSNVLYNHLGFTASVYTRSGEDSTGFDALNDLYRQLDSSEDARRRNFLDELLAYKKSWKLLTAFYKNIPELIKYDGRVHTTYKLGGTVTGRLSSSGPNVQQVPRDKAVKGMFAASPGYSWISFDYAQLELRIAAFLSGEPVLREAFENGLDVHTAVMADLKGIPYDELVTSLRTDTKLKNERVAVKRINFGILFGIAGQRLQRLLYNELRIEYDLGYCNDLITGWLNRYQKIRHWLKETERFAITNKYVRMPLGHIRRLPNIGYHTKEGRHSIRQATNFPIQSFEGWMVLIGMILLDDYLQNYDAHILMQTHDSIDIEMKGVTPEILADIKHLMEKDTIDYIDQMFGVKFDVPLEVTMSVGERWS